MAPVPQTPEKDRWKLLKSKFPVSGNSFAGFLLQGAWWSHGSAAGGAGDWVTCGPSPSESSPCDQTTTVTTTTKGTQTAHTCLLEDGPRPALPPSLASRRLRPIVEVLVSGWLGRGLHTNR